MTEETDRTGGKILRVQILGKFIMRYREDHILFHKTGNAKSVRLFQMLLLPGEQEIAKGEIMDFLYGWSEGTDAGNHNKNLNSLCYRPKGQLAISGLPEEEYVVIQDGVCRWRSSFKIELDAAYSETLVYRAEESQGREWAVLLPQASQSYYGELLPMNQSDVWFYEKSESFRRLYVETIRELEQAFKSDHDYQNLLKLYARAFTIYSFENQQAEQIRCCLGVYQYEEAINIYNRTTGLYVREMGNPPMEEMQKCLEDLELLERKHKRSVQAWHVTSQYYMESRGGGGIVGAIFEEGDITGVYYCTYPSFVDYCRLLLRARERYNLKLVLMFLTLGQQGKRRGQDNRIYQMELLKDAIDSSLRKGDAYTQCGSRHYVLLPTKINKEFCSIIFQRIESAYSKVPGSWGGLQYRVTMTQELEKTMLEQNLYRHCIAGWRYFCAIHGKMGRGIRCGRMRGTSLIKRGTETVTVPSLSPGLKRNSAVSYFSGLISPIIRGPDCRGELWYHVAMGRKLKRLCWNRTCIVITLPGGDTSVSFIEKWEDAPDVTGCRIPLLIKLTLRSDTLD